MWVFLPILVWPLVEIALFVTVGAWLGLWWTLAIVLGTAVLGFNVLRGQGLGKVQEYQRSGRGDPLSPLAHQAMIAIAGILLILPGFLTDAIGLLLLIPFVRKLVIVAVAARVAVATFSTGARPAAQQGDWIDGDYEVLPPEHDRLNNRPPGQGGSKWSGH